MNPFFGAFLINYLFITNHKSLPTMTSSTISSSSTTSTSTTQAKASKEEDQSIFIIRHGDRWDYSHPEWKESAQRKGDPSLSTLGHRQAREVGQYLDTLFVKEGIHADDVTLLSSPFLRCIQTSNELLSEFRHCQGDVSETVQIKPEYSIFEFDLWNDGLHHSLPETMEERKNYFPRIDVSHSSTFVPNVPESVDEFLKRCEKTMEFLEKEHGSKPVLILVTHAACCIGLAKAATKLTLQDVNPAAPCSIYRLKRQRSTATDITANSPSTWEMDHYSTENGFNGFTGHLKDDLGNTFPWNHFGRNEQNRGEVGAGYTGPPQQQN